MRILVTGACGYIGRNLIAALDRADWVEHVVGLDIRAPEEREADVEFVQRDLRAPLDDILKTHAITTVVHLAYVVAPIHDAALTEDINEQGTRNVLEACARNEVRHLIYTSSLAAYGLYADNDTPLTEESPLRGNDDFDYARTKKRIEPMLEGFAGANPKTAVTVLRPCFVIGPGCGDPLTAHLRKRVVFVPRRALPMQFVHVTDVISILMHFLQTQTPGTFNVAAEGTIPMPEMVKLLGNLRLALFWPTIYFFNELAWRLRLRFVTEVPSSALRFLVFPSVMSTEKLRRETGYEFQYDTQAAFEDFARWASRPPRPSPSKDASRIAVRRALARLRAGDT